MQKLIQGPHHCQTAVFGSPRELFERLAQGQSPEVPLITCSDSRITPFCGHSHCGAMIRTA
ncbi:MAG: hypothetical protein AB1648_11765 [Pseudomonadota bacterium]